MSRKRSFVAKPKPDEFHDRAMGIESRHGAGEGNVGVLVVFPTSHVATLINWRLALQRSRPLRAT